MALRAVRRPPRGESEAPGRPGLVSVWSFGPVRRWHQRPVARALFLVAVFVPVLALLAAAVVIPLTAAAERAGQLYTGVPLARPPVGPQTTFVYDRDGRLLTTLHAGIDRTVVPSSQIPTYLKQAVVAVEDRSFYREGGISPTGILRAAIVNMRSGRIVQGGSTITQQYVKNVYLGSSRTFSRKVREAILAQKLDQVRTKDEILTGYLNTVYFGNGAYGAQAAAERYFGIPAAKLTILQSATLAATVAAPAVYDPVRHPAAARERRNEVLRDLSSQGYITQDQAAHRMAQPIRLHRVYLGPDPVQGYFEQYVSQQLQSRFGVSRTFSGGLRVRTTLDAGMQGAAERAVAAHIPSPTDPAAALVAIDPRTGEIRAMVGGRDFRKRKYNYAVQAHRQAGSAFKTFTLTTAMEQHISPNSVWDGPSQITIDDPRCMTDNKPWQLHNAGDGEAGVFTLFQGIVHSVNTVYAQVVTAVGPGNVARVANAMGIRSHLEPVCSITLGSQPVTPLDMTDAYATLAARGTHHAPTPIDTVKSATGSTLWQANSAGNRALSQNNADLVTQALQGVIQSGTGTAANIGRPAAGKTGTAQNYQDAWFCGFVPQLSACVWMGYPKNESTPMVNVEGVPEVFGGTIPAEIWHDFMLEALKDVPAQDFYVPSYTGYNRFPHHSGIGGFWSARTNPAGAGLGLPPATKPHRHHRHGHHHGK